MFVYQCEYLSAFACALYYGASSDFDVDVEDQPAIDRIIEQNGLAVSVEPVGLGYCEETGLFGEISLYTYHK